MEIMAFYDNINIYIKCSFCFSKLWTFFNIEMKKFKKLNNNFELFTLFISLIIAEKFFLNIHMNRHHIIGLSLICFQFYL